MMQILLLRWSKLVAAFSNGLSIRALLTKRVLAGFEHRPVLTSTRLATVVDIGANRGQFSLACRIYNPDCRIFAFEPLIAPGDIFQTLLGEDANVHLFRSAVGPSSGTGLMHVTAKNDSSSLLAVGERQVNLFPSSVEVAQEAVPMVRLAQVLAPADLVSPAMLKLDVQGYERQVLEGCSDLLSVFDCVYVECSFEELYAGQALASEVAAHLNASGFDLAGVYNTYYDNTGTAIQADFLFRRR